MPKYIDADALLAQMKDRRFYVGRRSDPVCIVEDAPAADVEPKRKWIPVTERLPEKLRFVLVFSKFVKMETDCVSNDGNWYSTPGVTHWMPLPEPPKEEDDA